MDLYCVNVVFMYVLTVRNPISMEGCQLVVIVVEIVHFYTNEHM